MKIRDHYRHFFVAIIIFIFFIPFNPVNADPIDFSTNHTFPSDTLNELIEVRAYDQNYDHHAAQEMIDRIAVFPEIILKETVKQGVKLLLIDFPLTDLPEFQGLQGEVPRGWEHTNSTWDDVPGAGGQTSVARIGYSEPGNDHGTINLEYHEFSHAIDHYMLGYSISDTTEFIQIHEEEKSKMWPDGSFNADYMNHVEEYFAETSALYYLGGEHKENLKKIAPKTFDYIERLPKRILSIENNDSSGVSLAWEEIDEADEYHIYRDGFIIDTVDILQFTDYHFEENTLHSYQVQATDTAGNIVNETFVNGVMTSTLTIPAAPKNVMGTLTDDFTVILEWEEVPLATEYFILRNGEEISSVGDHYFIDEWIDDNEEYNYAIQASNIAGVSPTSSSVLINTFHRNELKNVETANSQTEAEQPPKEINRPNYWFYIILIGGIVLFGGFMIISVVLFFVFRKWWKTKNEST